MTRLLLAASRRFYLHHPWQLALAILGIALGVAVYLGVDLASSRAERGFELSANVVTGKATHRLLPIGGMLPNKVYHEVVVDRGLTNAAPIIEATVTVSSQPGRRYTLLGIDPLKEPSVHGAVGIGGATANGIRTLMTRPGSVLIPQDLSNELGLSVGDPLSLTIAGQDVAVTVGGILEGDGAGSSTPIIADISTAQVLTAMGRTISRIDLRLDASAARQLAANPPAGTVLVPTQANTGFDQLSAAFRTNLTALSLLALLVGMFLIYSTMTFAIVQRRSVMGTLAAMGVDHRQLLTTVLIEASVIGVCATVLGLALGEFLSRGLINLVLQTIGDFSYGRAIRAAPASPWVYGGGAALGVGATLVAALGPAIDAARSEPDASLRRAALERRSHRRSTVAAWMTLPALGVALLLLLVAPRSLHAGFAALFCVLGAGALATPLATKWLMRWIEPVANRGFGLAGRLAVRGVAANLSRTGVATAALAIAVAAVIGIGLMIGSFRSSLTTWLHTTLASDFYIAMPRIDASSQAHTIDMIAALPGVEGLSLARTVLLPTTAGPLEVRARKPGPEGWGLDIVSSGPQAAMKALSSSSVVAVSEPFAYRKKLGVGDAITLPTPGGPKHFPIVAVYRDYDTNGGAVLMSLALYRRIWKDMNVTGISVTRAPGTSVTLLRDSMEAVLPAGTRIRSNEGIFRLSLRIFDRTFKITSVLRVLAAVTAFLGILGALLAMQLERTREMAVLRALGFSPHELGQLVIIQTTLLGIAAGLWALPIGTLVAGLLVQVINRRAFGWTMEFSVSAGPLVSGFALAVAAAFLAGLYPAWRNMRTNLAGALREE